MCRGRRTDHRYIKVDVTGGKADAGVGLYSTARGSRVRTGLLLGRKTDTATRIHDDGDEEMMTGRSKGAEVVTALKVRGIGGERGRTGADALSR